MTLAATVKKLSARGAAKGYPQFVWWIPLLIYAITFGSFALALAQRVPGGLEWPAALLIGAAMIPWVLDIFTWRVPWPLTIAMALVPTAWVMHQYPPETTSFWGAGGNHDFLSITLVMLAGHVGAIQKFWASALATAMIGGVLVWLGLTDHLEGWGIWLTGVSLGWDVGFIMQFQQRQLDQQESAAANERTRALQAERQRIAREVHDVLAHSLSVTMLHLTAARHSLEDDDVEEATDALRDAEAAGRQAMSEIRNTVGLLGQQQAGPARPAPDAGDIVGLVEQFRGAGLDVSLELTGDPAAVPATAGLGVFRIVQESLANVAKHQPTARVGVVLDLHRDKQSVQVWNTLPAPLREPSGGTGLVGMRQRAELLEGAFEAGPRGGLWVVEARLPAKGTCALGLPRLGRSTSAPEPA